WQQLADALRVLSARPARLRSFEPDPPEQARPLRLDGEQQVLDPIDVELVGSPRKGGQGLLDPGVVDGARGDRLDGVRPLAMEAETQAVRGWDRFELSPDPVAPWVVHPQHWRVGRKPEARPRPRLLDHLPLQLQLVRVGG